MKCIATHNNKAVDCYIPRNGAHISIEPSSGYQPVWLQRREHFVIDSRNAEVRDC